MALAEEGKDSLAFPFFDCLTTLSQLTDLVVVVGGDLDEGLGVARVDGERDARGDPLRTFFASLSRSRCLLLRGQQDHLQRDRDLL
jgi:hypothetical protein